MTTDASRPEGTERASRLAPPGATPDTPSSETRGRPMLAEPRTWVMVALTAVFVGLYVLALVGWISASPDAGLLGRLEPIVFAIVGYYFGRLPSEQNEKNLRDQVERERGESDEERLRHEYTRDADRRSREESARLSGRLESATAVLRGGLPPAPASKAGGPGDGADADPRVASALEILQAGD